MEFDPSRINITFVLAIVVNGASEIMIKIIENIFLIYIRISPAGLVV